MSRCGELVARSCRRGVPEVPAFQQALEQAAPAQAAEEAGAEYVAHLWSEGNAWQTGADAWQQDAEAWQGHGIQSFDENNAGDGSQHNEQMQDWPDDYML